MEYEHTKFNTVANYMNSLYFNYEYNNILFSFSSGVYDINHSKIQSDKYISIGYRVIDKNYFISSYIGIKKASTNQDISTTNDNKYISFEYDYYSNNFIYFIGWTYNITIPQDSNYINYIVGSSYIYKDFEFKLSYNNSGSLASTINEYNYMLFSTIKKIDDNIYIKFGYNQNLDDNIYDLSFSIGVNFE